MKKQILFLLALFLIGTTYAQEKIYVSLGIGGGFGTASSYDFSTNNQKAHPVALGKGFDAMLRAGYFVNNFMAVELGVGYRMGINTKIDLSSNTSFIFQNKVNIMPQKSFIVFCCDGVHYTDDDSKTGIWTYQF